MAAQITKYTVVVDAPSTAITVDKTARVFKAQEKIAEFPKIRLRSRRLKFYMPCVCQEGGGAERVKPLIRAFAPDRGLRSCETLRWVCGVQSDRGHGTACGAFWLRPEAAVLPI